MSCSGGCVSRKKNCSGGLTRSLPRASPVGLPVHAWHAVASAKEGRSRPCGSILTVDPLLLLTVAPFLHSWV